MSTKVFRRHLTITRVCRQAPNRHKSAMRRIGEMAELFPEACAIAPTALISPFRVDCERVRQLAAARDCLEIHVKRSLEAGESRNDCTGAYTREVREFTGISTPWGEPTVPEPTLDTSAASIDRCVETVLALLKSRGLIQRGR